MDDNQDQLPQEGDIQPIIDLGSSLIRTERGTIYVLTIVGQIEGPPARVQNMSMFCPCWLPLRGVRRSTVCSFC